MIEIGPGQTFDPVDHLYRDQGKLVPFFSWVMRVEGLTDDRFSSPRALNRGKEVHKICHYLAKGTLDWKTVDDSLLGYVEAYQRFLQDTGFVPDVARCEVPIINPTYGYGVTPDQPGHLPVITGGVSIYTDAVTDFKTVGENGGAFTKWVRLQTAAQAVSLWPTGYLSAKRLAAQLRPDGTWMPDYHEDPDDFDAWFNMLGSAVWKLNNGYVKLEKSE